MDWDLRSGRAAAAHLSFPLFLRWELPPSEYQAQRSLRALHHRRKIA
jgi:hypothetical protein